MCPLQAEHGTTYIDLVVTVCPFLRMFQLQNFWTRCNDTSLWRILRKTFNPFQFTLKFDIFDGCFT
jgi:hypothetical protein